jgi:hypothetical protein
MEELIKIIELTCLKHHDSGESSFSREARLILQALVDNDYQVLKSVGDNSKQTKIEDIMSQIMNLCINYCQLFLAEQAIRNENDNKARKSLMVGYLANKDIFDTQYKKVEDLIRSKQHIVVDTSK